MNKKIVIPDLLKNIIKWQREITSEVPYLENPTGYFLQFNVEDNGRYH